MLAIAGRTRFDPVQLAARVLPTASALLFPLGFALLVSAQNTPWRSSEDYYRASTELRELWFQEAPDFEAMSREFHALQDRYRTALAVLTALQPGSWAISPALAVLGWLALNARVLATAPLDATPAPAPSRSSPPASSHAPPSPG